MMSHAPNSGLSRTDSHFRGALAHWRRRQSANTGTVQVQLQVVAVSFFEHNERLYLYLYCSGITTFRQLNHGRGARGAIPRNGGVLRI